MISFYITFYILYSVPLSLFIFDCFISKKPNWPNWAGLALLVSRLSQKDSWTWQFHNVQLLWLGWNTNKEFIQSEVVVCKKEYWDLKVKLLPLCLHSVGILKIRLVKLKIRTDLQGICIKCSAHPLWVIANKIESFTMNDSVICFLSDMFMAAHAYLRIGTYLYTMCIMFNQYSKSFYISRDGCFHY